MKEILYKTKFLNLMSAKRENAGDWVYAHRPNAKDIAVIVPILHKKDGDYTIFLITKRPPITEEYGEKFCIEFPAGLVGDEDENETTKDALNKELLEETGYIADGIKILVKNLTSSAGLTSETSTLALAHIYDLEKKRIPTDDGGIIVKRKEIPINKIDEFLAKAQNDGHFVSAQTLSGLYFIKKG